AALFGIGLLGVVPWQYSVANLDIEWDVAVIFLFAAAAMFSALIILVIVTRLFPRVGGMIRAAAIFGASGALLAVRNVGVVVLAAIAYGAFVDGATHSATRGLSRGSVLGNTSSE